MVSNPPTSNIRINNQLAFTPSGKEAPTALSMMVDSMTSMMERAKQDLESVDQRAREDIMRLDQKARADLGTIDQRARKDLMRLDQKARADHEKLRRG